MVYVASYERMPRTLEDVGLKALALAHMQDAQLTLPPYRILTAAFSQHALGQLEEKARFVLDELSITDAAKSLQSLVRNMTLPTELVSILSEAFRSLTFNEYADKPVRRLAVRLSRAYLSEREGHVVLGVKHVEGLVQAVKDVWAAEFTLDALKERLQKGLDLFYTRIPLVLQQYVPPTATAYLIPRDEHTFHIIAWRGVNTHRDMHAADHYLVDHEQQNIVKLLNNTPGEVLVFSEEEDAIIPLHLEDAERAQPFLTPKAISNAVHQYQLSREQLHETTLEFISQGDRIVFITMKETPPLRMAAEAALTELERSAEVRSEDPYTQPLSPAHMPATPPDASTRASSEEASPIREEHENAASAPIPSSSSPHPEPLQDSQPASEQPPAQDTGQDISSSHAVREHTSAPSDEEVSSRGDVSVGDMPIGMSDEVIMREIEKAVHQLEAFARDQPRDQTLLPSQTTDSDISENTPRSEGVTAEDVYKTVERLVEKYITINPDLEKVFHHFLTDLRREYTQ